MRSLADTTDLPVRTASLYFESNRKGEVVTMLATEVVPPPGKKRERRFKLVSEARARDGGPPVRDQFEGSTEVVPGVPVILARQWHLTPGVWQARLLVEDRPGPHLPDGHHPVLPVQRHGASVAGKHDWAPHALGKRALRRGEEIVREAPPTLIQPGGDGRLTPTLGISLQGAPPGEYAITLTVDDEKTGETLSRTEPFTVGP